MRSIEASLVIHKSTRDVWQRLASLECWQELTGAFAGWGARFHYSRADKPSEPLGKGAEVIVSKPNGKPLMRWRVNDWTPQKSLELVSNESGRWFTKFHMILGFKLEELDSERTNVTGNFVIIYMNQVLELLSLVLPIGFMYRRGLFRAMRKLRETV